MEQTESSVKQFIGILFNPTKYAHLIRSNRFNKAFNTLFVLGSLSYGFKISDLQSLGATHGLTFVITQSMFYGLILGVILYGFVTYAQFIVSKLFKKSFAHATFKRIAVYGLLYPVSLCLLIDIPGMALLGPRYFNSAPNLTAWEDVFLFVAALSRLGIEFFALQLYVRMHKEVLQLDYGRSILLGVVVPVFTSYFLFMGVTILISLL